ncbi:MAG: hypothetical protein A3C88_00940 [Candidatus Yanofskybacteria bacterium RIFCSPHIGHO2_02_FULL_50_12]|uniref:PsbP C-terminal domain-containing protein n=1 Tax=Candidatus Yanofskybacteria bacterium RIFCSPHIGHO2_02_FULL_50_12 TaxID=1802685 RepID=A0A1F8G080_9BACT|nr:MAG: hypothetical protein A3C88_00940 [Candidatus Yanofskybacteria bacterium RIFCSPHIGHO2_02_FULL_50_12]
MKKIFIIVVAILIVAGAAWYFMRPSSSAAVKTYINSTLGFEIKYPETWRSEECTYDQYGVVSFGDYTEPLLICNSDAPPLSYVNVNAIGPIGEYDRLIQNTQNGLDNVQRSDTELDGEPAVRIYGETRATEGPGVPVGIKMTLVFTKHADKIYLVSHWNLENKDHTAELEQMLKSFRFTN